MFGAPGRPGRVRLRSNLGQALSARDPNRNRQPQFRSHPASHLNRNLRRRTGLKADYSASTTLRLVIGAFKSPFLLQSFKPVQQQPNVFGQLFLENVAGCLTQVSPILSRSYFAVGTSADEVCAVVTYRRHAIPIDNYQSTRS